MKKKIATGLITAAMLTMAAQTAVFAMPADIEEAVTQSDYNAYNHQSSYSYYDESDLISVNDYYVATAQAMIRRSPFGEILGSVTPGQKYYVVGECSDCMWYKISGNVSGYVYASYMTPASDYSAPSSSQQSYNVRSLDMKMTVTAASAVNVRKSPSASGALVTSLKNGTEVHVTGNVLNTEWYECKYNGETVYICDDYLTPELPQTMACTAKALNVRASASSNGQIIGTLNHGDKEKISADENGWLRFSLPDGRIGYVSDEYMAVVDQ
ncbi:SH3 domain-containing protein [Blautia sp. MSJ-19]|uniref:SH3 domain-containing protein n=1 Tax=Blautia sp. MSJ-19 TaxID=2841517 RepID=UPI001C0F3B09|nr:SH3 domain-containing protein [Blautia sp. MSJ-19]MBU5479829.1 SH3 domain-containing protein [Blautia sp. MSJ-19]